jgi:hypothetical protein
MTASEIALILLAIVTTTANGLVFPIIVLYFRHRWIRLDAKLDIVSQKLNGHLANKEVIE